MYPRTLTADFFAAVGLPVASAPSVGHGVLRGALAQRGVTLIELLIVLSIAGLLATIAVPSFRDIIYNLRQSSAASLVLGDLNQARGEAIKRNTRVLVCARNAAGTDCESSVSWNNGWVVCAEGAAANQCAAGSAANPNPVVIRPPLHAALSMAKTGASTATEPVRFSANSGGSAATLTVSGSWSGVVSRQICVAGTGNISKPTPPQVCP